MSQDFTSPGFKLDTMKDQWECFGFFSAALGIDGASVRKWKGGPPVVFTLSVSHLLLAVSPVEKGRERDGERNRESHFGQFIFH